MRTTLTQRMTLLHHPGPTLGGAIYRFNIGCLYDTLFVSRRCKEEHTEDGTDQENGTAARNAGSAHSADARTAAAARRGHRGPDPSDHPRRLRRPSRVTLPCSTPAGTRRAGR